MNIRLPHRHSGQLRVYEEQRRVNILAAGRRWYKSTFLMTLAVEAGFAGKRVFVGAPTYDQVRIIWREMQYAVGDNANFNQSRMEVSFPNAGLAVFRSLDDPLNSKGHSADLVLLDEAANLKPSAYYETLLPMLAQTGGVIWLAGTPLGRNYFWVEHQKKGRQRKSWQIPTLGVKVVDGKLTRLRNLYENPHIDFGEIQRYFTTVPRITFNQEILAHFAEQENPLFRNVRECATAGMDQTRQAGNYYIGVDLGRHNDYSVFTVMTPTEVVHIDRFTDISYKIQEARLLGLCEKFHPTTVLIEGNSAGEPFCESMADKNVPVEIFWTTNASKREMVDALILAFEKREIKIPNDETLINELLAFEATQLPVSGKIRYAAPSGLHDDMVISLSLAYKALRDGDSHKLEFTHSEFLWNWRGGGGESDNQAYRKNYREVHGISHWR